jgi:hypothetical protein
LIRVLVDYDIRCYLNGAFLFFCALFFAGDIIARFEKRGYKLVGL